YADRADAYGQLAHLTGLRTRCARQPRDELVQHAIELVRRERAVEFGALNADLRQPRAPLPPLQLAERDLAHDDLIAQECERGLRLGLPEILEGAVRALRRPLARRVARRIEHRRCERLRQRDEECRRFGHAATAARTSGTLERRARSSTSRTRGDGAGMAASARSAAITTGEGGASRGRLSSSVRPRTTRRSSGSMASADRVAPSSSISSSRSGSGSASSAVRAPSAGTTEAGRLSRAAATANGSSSASPSRSA